MNTPASPSPLRWVQCETMTSHYFKKRMKLVTLLCFGFVSLICMSQSEKGVYVDSIPNKDSLQTFFLSYAEWIDIKCVISADRDAYWDKAMIGLIEKSGKLRIKFKNEVQYLKPVKIVNITQGKWANIYRNDFIEISITSSFDNGEILRSLTGQGKLTLKSNNQTVEKDAYFVCHTE